MSDCGLASGREEDLSVGIRQNGSGKGVTSSFPILTRTDFSKSTFLVEIEHPVMAKAARPGQFVIVMLHEQGERVPLTIADFDRDKGTITLVVQAVGKSTREMQLLCKPGRDIYAMLGPLGIPSEISSKTKKVICVGGGLGIAPIYPQARAFKEAGAHVIGILGFRSSNLMFWEEKFRAICDDFIICTDDGSAGIQGLVTAGIEAAIKQNPDVDEVVAIGPPVMMRACAETTRPYGIKTMVSLNPIMVDGTGMCGGCRVKVGDEIKFACVDGPDFDGHKVDFADLFTRLQRYRPEEAEAMERYSESCRRLALAPDAAPSEGGK